MVIMVLFWDVEIQIIFDKLSFGRLQWAGGLLSSNSIDVGWVHYVLDDSQSHPG
jgi:hypothetical protein